MIRNITCTFHKSRHEIYIKQDLLYMDYNKRVYWIFSILLHCIDIFQCDLRIMYFTKVGKSYVHK